MLLMVVLCYFTDEWWYSGVERDVPPSRQWAGEPRRLQFKTIKQAPGPRQPRWHDGRCGCDPMVERYAGGTMVP